MTATYTGDPAKPLDRMRMTVADIVVGLDEAGNEQALREDELYLGLLAELGDWRLAAAEVADQLAQEYAQAPTSFTRPGSLAISWADRVKTWQATAQRLRQQVADERAAANRRLRTLEAVRTGWDADAAEYERSGPFTRWYGE